MPILSASIVKSLGINTLPIQKRSILIFDFIRLLKFVYSNSIDVIHSHGKGAGIYSRLLKIFCPRIKVIHTFHGYHYDGMSNFKQWLHKSVEKFLSRFTDRFVNVSEGEQLQYAMGGLLVFNKSVLIKNCIPVEKLKLIEALIKIKADGRSDNKLSIAGCEGGAKDFIKFCATARFDPVKQMPFLVESFVKALNAKKFCGRAKLILIGGGEEYEKCRALADKMNAGSIIEFAGERDDALELMAGCDIYISASRREGLSMSMLEAIACGLPILAPRVAGIAELVRPYEKGVLFENNDYESFERALVLIVEKYNASWKRGRSGGEDFAAKYEEHKRYIKKYEKLYIETVS